MATKKSESYYCVAGICLRMNHEGDELFDWINDEIKYYKSEKNGNFDCEVNLFRSSEIKIYEKAIRSAVDEKGRELYSFGHLLQVTKNKNFVIELDFDKKRINVTYKSDEAELYSLVRGFIKWLFIKSAEDKGLAYIHAAAVNYKGKNIIIAGDTNSGKSSFVMRLIQNGAKVISDDSMLIRQNELIPFTFKAAVDSDFSERFGVKQELFAVGNFLGKDKYKGADILFFINIWNSQKSEIKPVDYNHALLNLIKIYKKESGLMVWSSWERNNSEKLKLIFERYSLLIEKTKCFEFFAGNDEREIREKMLVFLDEN
jgi:hypothetical protein